MTLHNGNLRVTVDKETGCITSLFDLRTKYETLAPGACGNQLQYFKDTPKDYDAWNIDPGTLDQQIQVPSKADSVELLRAQSFHPEIRITRSWQSSKFVQVISLDPGSDEVEVDNEFDWHESHVLLKAAFPLAASSDFATYEIPYGSIDRPTTWAMNIEGVSRRRSRRTRTHDSSSPADSPVAMLSPNFVAAARRP